jgi:dTDP-4-dehydrorhamnose reductase
MKVLITGANGQLGTDLQLVLREGHELFPFDLDLDITDASAVDEKLGQLRPDVVVHAAAYTDVDGAESHPELAFQVNALGTQNVALACQKIDAAMVYVSTDYVFDGTKGEPYLEFDRTNPLSVYGQSKLAGEIYTTTLLDRFYLVRTAWLYGRTGKNFVKTVLCLAEEKKELQIVDDQIGSPTFSYDLARVIARLIGTGWYGFYHAVNVGASSWRDFAISILKAAGKEGVRVDPISTKELARPAPRPGYSVLKNLSLEMRGIQMRRHEEALQDYFEGGPGRPK